MQASSITHPGKTSHRMLSAAILSSLDILGGTIRVSVGIENTEDIVLDFLRRWIVSDITSLTHPAGPAGCAEGERHSVATP